MKSEFEAVLRNNPIVHAVIQNGGTIEDCCVALDQKYREMMNEIVRLSSLVPRRFKLADGREMIYHTPDHLVPLEK